MSNPLPLAEYFPGNHLRLSNSSIQLFRSCARKFEFRKIYESNKRDEGIPADAGTALHAGYQHWFVHRDEDAAIWEFMKRYPWHLNDNPNFNRSGEACLYTLLHMMNSGLYSKYEIAHVVNDKGETVPAVEVPFEINLINSPLEKLGLTCSYIGFIDFILFDRPEQKHVVSDIKTHRDDSRDLIPKWANDDQATPYGLVLEQALGRPLVDLEVHYMSTFIDIQKPQVQDFEFMKSTVAIRDWARHLLIDLQQIAMFIDMQWWPRHGGSCINFKKPCKFYDMCHERRHDVLTRIVAENNGADVHVKEPWLRLDLELAA